MITRIPSPAESPAPALIVTHGNTANKHRPLKGDTMLLGRARGCDLRLESPEVSEVHCVLVRGPDGLRVRDCSSRTGTRLNGQPIREAMLHDGDTLQVGLFSFEVSLPVGCAPVETPVGPVMAGAELPLRLQRSRRRLVQIALALRRRLRSESVRDSKAAQALTQQQAELERSAAALREKWDSFEKRAWLLEEGERTVARDRALLDQDRAALEDAHRQLADDRARMETELRQQSAEWQRRCEEAERRLAEQLQKQAAALEDPDLAAQRSTERGRYLLEARLPLAGEPGGPQTGPKHETPLPGAPSRQAVVAVLANRAQLERELQGLRSENERLRELVAEHEDAPTEQVPWLAEAADLRRQVALLAEQLREKQAELEELDRQGQAAQHAARMETMGDVEKYEAELNEFRRQLQADRSALDREMHSVQERQAELDEAVRTEEVQLARERAQLARERAQLDQMREQLRMDIERAEREGQVRRRLAGLQRPRG